MIIFTYINRKLSDKYNTNNEGREVRKKSSAKKEGECESIIMCSSQINEITNSKRVDIPVLSLTGE